MTVLPSDTEVLQLQAASSTMGWQLADAEARLLCRYLDLLQRWNATYNLTAVRDRSGMRVQHVVDCLSLIAPLRRFVAAAARPPRRILDVGSGGGLPGVVIAILFPEMKIVCVDAVGKKAVFVQQVAIELALPNLQATKSRVENMDGQPFDIVVSRAFASLDALVKLTRTQLRPGGAYLAMKGKAPLDEIDALPADMTVFHVEHLTVPGLDAERCLVWMHPAGIRCSA